MAKKKKGQAIDNIIIKAALNGRSRGYADAVVAKRLYKCVYFEP